MLHGQFMHIELSPEPLIPSLDDYTLIVELNTLTDKSLTKSKKYFYIIYPYVENTHNNIVVDYLQGIDISGKPIGDNANYYFTNERRTLELAQESLKSLRLDLKTSEHMYGYIYKGNDFPTKIRFYLETGEDFKIEKTRAFLIYVHHETKLGRNLSWVKTLPIEIIQN